MICRTCKEPKEENQLCKIAGKLVGWCLECRRLYYKNRWHSNPTYRAQVASWKNRHPEDYKKSKRETIRRNIASTRLYAANRRKNDPWFRLRNNLSKRIWKILKGVDKSESTMILLGCSLKEFTTHIEKQWTEGMSWDNYGSGWHIDHIKPCILFDLTKPSEQKICFNHKNMQPLWAADNLKKSDKYVV